MGGSIEAIRVLKAVEEEKRAAPWVLGSSLGRRPRVARG
jgi:hypothetical protein